VSSGHEPAEQSLLERAQRGDESAFGDLVAPYRSELHAHGYRILGSVHDAEDALQEALLRAWRGLPRFQGRSSVRPWLHTIVSNAALDLTRRRARQGVPAGLGPAGFSPPGARPGPGEPGSLAGPPWLEPYPDRALGDQPAASPEARYELRESLELAFIIALQHLPPAQRAVLILRDVVGLSAREMAGQLGMTVPAVTSALQRARATLAGRLPDRSQQAALRSLGDERIRALAGRYADAIERGDADMLVSMLTRDATWTMPPECARLHGITAIREFLRSDVGSVRWRHRATRANGQLAVGCYTWEPSLGAYEPSVLDVLTLDGGQIAMVHAFIIAEHVQRPGHDGRFAAADFARFGLPAALPMLKPDE
jgi:RNA polymerase sigma-70 factor (ECF subfamily)